MRRSRVWWFVSLIAVLALSPAWTLAEGEKKSDETAKADTAAGKESAETAKTDTEAGKPTGEKAELPAVITNDFLQRYRDASTAEAASDEPAAPKAKARPGGAKSAKPGAEPGPAKAAEPKMSEAERSARIAEIDAELERLDRRILALKNPLLRGTVPPTEEEKQDEKGMNNIEMIQSTEQRIAELKSEKRDLQNK